MCISFELESAKKVAQKELDKNEETIKELLHLLKEAWEERDQAKNQLKFLLHKLCLSSKTTPPFASPQPPRFDPAKDSGSSVIDSLVRGKTLPEKGRLLEAVMDAGPLLQTLLVAPLPEWRNPPPLLQIPASNFLTFSDFESTPKLPSSSGSLLKVAGKRRRFR
ncbi:hypothetical protein UlMin_005976 [Ulmus minor]